MIVIIHGAGEREQVKSVRFAECSVRCAHEITDRAHSARYTLKYASRHEPYPALFAAMHAMGAALLLAAGEVRFRIAVG